MGRFVMSHYMCSIYIWRMYMHIYGILSCDHDDVLLVTGASENVAKTNWRFVVWLLMRKSGLLTVLSSRLDLGHTHYDPDQRHAVFNQSVRGIRGGRQRKDIHSLG